MFGINASEFLVLLAVAAVVLGPERLPQYTQQLARLIRELRRMAAGAQEKVREELGPEFDDVDWRALDPRQYDPRRIVREALSDAVDFDDPLGLKQRPGDDPAGKPVSRGGPGDTGKAVTGSNGAAANGAAATAGSLTAGDDVESVFDPDAT